ncbi:MAG: hypothetical protein CBC36_09775 [Verrucomicrobiaceae bacterium TMED76]|nr:MAG: hypothetical protein CBC36_09775 [Verrucomicrobiaceae bacterium TMED76]
MDPIKAKVIFEISTLCLIGIIIGLFVFWLYRIKPKKNALYRNRYFPENKKEIIDPVIKIDLFDLMIVITIILFFYANVALLYFETNNIGPSESSKAKVELSLNETLLSVGIFLIVGAVIFSLASVSRGRQPRQVFGLRKRSPSYVIKMGALGMIAVYGSVFIGSVISNILLSTGEPKKEDLQEIVQTLLTNDELSLKIAIIISAVVVAPLVEEIIFRGYIYPVLKRFTHPAFSCVMTSLLFAVIHTNVESLISLFFLAIVLTMFYEKTKSIWVPILMHSIFNGVNTFFILKFSDAI